MTDGHKGGRPRSESARTAILHAVDDLLVEVGYSAMTMKGIAERAGVGRQTVYRWWSTKAQVLAEACIEDARRELTTPDTGSTVDDFTAYLATVGEFLTHSPAGAAYRALLGEAQHDHDVAALVAQADVLADSARPVLERAAARGDIPAGHDLTAQLVGPTFYRTLAGGSPVSADDAVAAFLRGLPAS